MPGVLFGEDVTAVGTWSVKAEEEVVRLVNDNDDAGSMGRGEECRVLVFMLLRYGEFDIDGERMVSSVVGVGLMALGGDSVEEEEAHMLELDVEPLIQFVPGVDNMDMCSEEVAVQ
jgi:hypothetical protein